MPTIFRQKVVCNGVTFNDPLALPDGAQAWGMDVTDGWRDTPDILEVSTEYGMNRDGVSAGDWFPIRKRYVTVGGYVKAATAADAETLSDLLVRNAFPRNVDIPFTRYEAVPKQITARRAAPVTTEWVMEDGFRWETTLMAEDPLKYGLTSVSGSAGVAGQDTGYVTFPITFPFSFTAVAGGTDSSVGINNIGTANSPNFTATLNGILPTGAWRLRNDTTDAEIGFNVALGITDFLTIDFKNEVATLNGFPVGATIFGDFFTLAPGVNTLRLYAEYDANAGVSIVAYPAWE